MRDPRTGDHDLIDRMHDFVKTYYGKNTSTEDFGHIVEKHMRRGLDLEGNGKMNWFFREWVFGTEVPSYKLKYSLSPGEVEKTMLAGTITHSGVSPNFMLRVPIYLDMNSTTEEVKVPLPNKTKHINLNAHHDVLVAEAVSEGN